MEKKDTKVVISNDEVDKIKAYIKEADEQLENLNSTFLRIEQKSKQKKSVNKIKKILRLVDVKSGDNLLKIILWMAMAWAIVKFSNDINAKIVSSLTYYAGLAVDMKLLRKQLPQVGYTTLRLIAGVCVLVFGVIIIILIANLVSISNGGGVYAVLEILIDKSIFICGFLSTFLEFINSIAIDD